MTSKSKSSSANGETQRATGCGGGPATPLVVLGNTASSQAEYVGKRLDRSQRAVPSSEQVSRNGALHSAPEGAGELRRGSNGTELLPSGLVAAEMPRKFDDGHRIWRDCRLLGTGLGQRDRRGPRSARWTGPRSFRFSFDLRSAAR